MPETKLESRTPRAADTAQPLRPRRLGHLPCKGRLYAGFARAKGVGAGRACEA